MATSMMRNILASVLVCMLFANYALAHTYLSSLFIDGQALNEGDCMRPHPPQQKEYPLHSVTDADMTCGWLPYAANPANRKCPVAAGSIVGLQWWHTSPGDEVMATTHQGPIIVYMSQNNGDWFKIYEDGFDASTRLWATDKLIANRGRVDVRIPSDLAPGNYILRGEILALHNAYDVGGIQPYVGCAELTISGSGSAKPQGVAFPGAYTPAGTGMLFDVYKYYNSYTIPGPAVYKPSAPSTLAPTVAPTARPTTVPTTAPTAAPTAAPATLSPTSRPTSAPPASPTTRPAPGNIKFSMNQGSNSWWAGVVMSNYNGMLVKVEILDSRSLPSFAPMRDMGYAQVFSESIQLELPCSLRLTSSRGEQLTLTNVITSWTMTDVDTGKNFASY